MLLYFVLLLIAQVQARTRIDPLVETSLGLIRGLHANDGDYSMFLGIPYAEVNQSNVFGDAIPVSKFTTVFEANSDRAMCPQVEDANKTISGSLDCLHLNIYVPNLATRNSPLPVLIWIHGGHLTTGYSGRYLYGPKFLVRHNIILITINYRMGPYGFMCLDIPEVSGNQGLKDQYLAINWIKQNIQDFGGDPNKITLMGESAGSKCVEAHMLSKREILFNKAIMQSGSILGPNVIELPDQEAPVKLAQHLGFETSNTVNALTFLNSLNTDLIIKASTELNLKFQMCVEKDFDNIEIFIHEHPEYSDYTQTNNVSILTGFNSKELMLNIARLDFSENLNYIKDNLNKLFYLEDQEHQDMIDIVTHFYTGEEPLVERKLELIDFISDLTYNYPVQRSVERFLKNNANVYQYLFSYDGERNLQKKKNNITIAGAAHADELAYLFDLSYDKNMSEMDLIVIDRMSVLWTNFVKYGNPTPKVTDLLPIEWKQNTEEKNYYMNINSDLTLGTRPFHGRMAFWKIFFKINEINHKANNYCNKLKGIMVYFGILLSPPFVSFTFNQMN